MTYRVPAGGLAPQEPRRSIVANAPHLFPRWHPSAGTCFLLAAASLVGFGPLTGVPAVGLAHLVLREVHAAPSLYFEKGRARAALWLGWVGTIFYAALGVLLVARATAPVGYLALVVGVFGGAGALAIVARRIRSDPRSAYYVMGVTLASAVALAFSGVGGVIWHARDATAAAAQCDQLQTQARASADRADFADAGRKLAEAEKLCVEQRLADARTFAASIPALEEEHRKQGVSKRFERARASAASHLKEAADLARSKRYVDADGVLRRAEEELDEFRDESHIAESAAWKGAITDIRRERAAIAPKADSELRTKIAALLADARRLSRSQQWTAASAKLTEAANLKTDWKPLESTIAQWRKLDGELDRERDRVTAGADAARRRREAQEEARQRAKEAAESAREASRRLRCCDGTLSPSCLCSRASRRGCCSHHGGVCGCE